MATLASRGSVCAEKRILRISLVVEENGFPYDLTVAFLAGLSEIGSMNVVFLMAAITICRGLVFVKIPLMATLAFRFLMVSLEWILCVPVVIEQERMPIPLRVTADAFLAKSAFVCVVFLVAGETIDWSLLFIERPLVTGFAFGPKVSPE